MRSKFIKDAFLFTITKYVVVALGLLRTIIVAALLTKSELGALAVVLLFFEYLSLFSPLGSIYSFNKNATNFQAQKNNISIQDKKIEDLYRSTTLTIILGLIISILLLFYVSNNFNLLSSNIENNLFSVIFIAILSVYRAYAVIHNRIWGKFKKIIVMELAYAICYLAGIALFFEVGENFISSYLNILIFSTIASIMTSRFIPKFKIKFERSLLSYDFFKLGIVLMIYNFLETFFWGLDRIFIAFYLLPNQLADFHIAHTWSRGILMVYMALTFLFTSELMKQLTLTDDLHRNSNIISKISQLTRSSEIILAVILIISVALLPFAITITMSKYSNIDNVLVLVLLGLMLKGMCFFPSSYMIANHLQKRLTIMSIAFASLASLIYFSLNKYISSSTEYLSISISIF